MPCLQPPFLILRMNRQELRLNKSNKRIFGDAGATHFSDLFCSRPTQYFRFYSLSYGSDLIAIGSSSSSSGSGSHFVVLW